MFNDKEINSVWLKEKIKQHYPKRKQRGFSEDSCINYYQINRHVNGKRTMTHESKLLYYLWFERHLCNDT